MPNFEDILNQALTELQRGSPKDEILSKWPQYKNGLEPALLAAEQLLALPKNKVPEPVMQRKYLQMPIKTRVWFAWLHMSRSASVSMAALLLLTGLTTTAYATMQSLPGTRLFGLKKTTEQIQLHFASSNAERAAVQMNITKKRLAEAQQVFNAPNTSPQQQLAALNELSTQTDAALQDVKSVAASGGTDSPPIAASLKDISHEQQTLLTTIQSKNNGQQAGAIKQLQQIVAATNEQATIISLKPDPNAAVFSGTISHVDAKNITVGSNNFLLASSTIVKNSDNKEIGQTTLGQGQAVTIIGNTDASTTLMTAKEILVLDGGSVQSTTTTAGTLPPTNATTSSSSSTSVKKVNGELFKKTTTTNDSSLGDMPIPSPDQAVGTFIPEDPSPQFTP